MRTLRISLAALIALGALTACDRTDATEVGIEMVTGIDVDIDSAKAASYGLHGEQADLFDGYLAGMNDFYASGERTHADHVRFCTWLADQSDEARADFYVTSLGDDADDYDLIAWDSAVGDFCYYQILHPDAQVQS